jgi:Lrp/AsnC family transcriptional regulator, leucine-responsive regulatory protein
MLEESGVVSRYVAVVDPAKVGLGLTLFTPVWLQAQDDETISHFVKVIE